MGFQAFMRGKYAEALKYRISSARAGSNDGQSYLGRIARFMVR